MRKAQSRQFLVGQLADSHPPLTDPIWEFRDEFSLGHTPPISKDPLFPLQCPRAFGAIPRAPLDAEFVFTATAVFRTSGTSTTNTMDRALVWVDEKRFQGWTCSRCDWNYPVPSLLTGTEARSAFDRLANTKFQEHDCGKYPKETRFADGQTFAERVRKLIMRGFKPKDAVELTLQEISFEHQHEPKVIQQAQIEAEEFLWRVRQGLI
ncbi:MAG TPA: hypothetical protein VFA89_18750 [Terriglobales bacterium]|nr:hypothetical protein [Terriglobales bacterium]